MKKGKRSKTEVNYSQGMPSAHCGLCMHYKAGACAMVQGQIDSGMWCRLFKRKR